MNAGLIGRARGDVRSACYVLISAGCYYLTTQIAWALCFPDSKVSLFFPPHAVLLSILLLVPTRHWWAYILAAASAHFLATQQAHWPPLYALHCEVFDAVKAVSAAAAIRVLIRSPLKALTLRDAIVFVLVAAVLVPFGAAFWGAGLTVFHGFGTRYWIEWRNLGISNAVTTVILVPALLLGARQLKLIWRRRQNALSRQRIIEAVLVGAGTVAAGVFVFNRTPAGPDTSPALLYLPIPLLIWAALRFGLGGTGAAMLLITVQAIWGTMRGRGPFLTQTPAENALALQLFLLVTATPLMLLAVVIEQDRLAQSEVQRKRAELAHFSRVAMLSELSTALAHEIKQPLAAILMNSAAGIDFLERPEPDLQEVRDALSDIYDDTRRADEVIRRLRDLLRRETPGFATLNLNDLIRSVERIVHSDAFRHGLTIQLDLSSEVVPVLGDSVELQQVMLNLLLNALGAMNERDRVARRLIVRTSLVHAPLSNRDSTNALNALVEVQDSGTGIPPDQLEAIFEPFMTTKPDGLGMGLAICRSIVERHRGTIRAANNPDRGATFSITLPLTAEAKVHPAAAQSELIPEYAA